MGDSYYLYQKYIKIGDQDPHPAYPVEYSVDGNGTMQKVLKMEDDPNCDVIDTTIYQWVIVAGEYECSGTAKCQKEKEQKSEDFGQTWTDTGNYRAGAVIEYNSEDCGWQPPQYRTVSGSPYCDGYTKMFDTWNQVSYDGGQTWENTGVSGSTVIEYNSPECGYPIYQWVPSDDYICVEGADAQYRTVSGTPYCDGYDLVVDMQEQVSPDGGQTWHDYGESSMTVIEEASEECGFNPLLGEYLTFEIVSSGTIVWRATHTAMTKTISYSLDSGATWTNIRSSTSGTIVNVSAGDKVMFKGNNTQYSTNLRLNSFRGTASFNIRGNIMSLINGDDFYNLTTLEESYVFRDLFGHTNVLSCENLMLPATTLSDFCYMEMFDGCASLATAPELPSTTLAGGCYHMMFRNCANLTTPPELLATILPSDCYNMMFAGCTILSYIKCLATDISASNCTQSWVSGVAANGVFVKAASMNSWGTGTSAIPTDWTVQNASS